MVTKGQKGHKEQSVIFWTKINNRHYTYWTGQVGPRVRQFTFTKLKEIYSNPTICKMNARITYFQYQINHRSLITNKNSNSLDNG